VLLGLVLLEEGRTEEAAETLVRASLERMEDAEAQVLAALAAAAVGWEESAEEAAARAAYAPEGADAALLADMDERIASAGAARDFLLATMAPSVLHERLTQPL
jgi:hypothetical protein